jgi:hypothetical protein
MKYNVNPCLVVHREAGVGPSWSTSEGRELYLNTEPETTIPGEELALHAPGSVMARLFYSYNAAGCLLWHLYDEQRHLTFTSRKICPVWNVV